MAFFQKHIMQYHGTEDYTVCNKFRNYIQDHTASLLATTYFHLPQHSYKQLLSSGRVQITSACKPEPDANTNQRLPTNTFKVKL